MHAEARGQPRPVESVSPSPRLHRRRRERRGLRSVFLRRLGHRAPSSSTANWRNRQGLHEAVALRPLRQRRVRAAVPTEQSWRRHVQWTVPGRKRRHHVPVRYLPPQGSGKVAPSIGTSSASNSGPTSGGDAPADVTKWARRGAWTHRKEWVEVHVGGVFGHLPGSFGHLPCNRERGRARSGLPATRSRSCSRARCVDDGTNRPNPSDSAKPLSSPLWL